MVAADDATPEQRAEYARITSQLRRWPDSSPLLPTRLGNTLLAAETHPADKYGLDAVRLWPHLWLLMPDPTRAAVGTARESLDRAGVSRASGGCYSSDSPRSACGRSRSALALPPLRPGRGHRHEPPSSPISWRRRSTCIASTCTASSDGRLPTNPAEERATGAQLTEYLVRGLTKPSPTFTADPGTEK